ncbi:MAG: DUF5906 domain-containing protein [Candidatus Paceibacterota bacterium]
MSGQISKILSVDDALFYLQQGLSPKKIEDLFSGQPDDVQEQVRALITLHKGKSPAQKAAEQMLSILEARLNSEFIVYRDEARTPVPLRKLSDYVVAESSLEGLCEIASAELKANGVKISKSKVKELAETWEMNATPVNQLPKSFSLSPTELTFNFISIDIADIPTPTFDNFISRCGSNGPALMAFIWSIFEDVEVQQYVLMRGEGKDGKGSLMRLIERLVGSRAYHGASSQDKHWVAKLVGKRVAFWADVNSTAFVMSEQFKSVTGGDKVTVEDKYKVSFSTKLDFRAFIATNNEPELTSKKSDLRRIIYVQVDELPTPIENYEEKLQAEAAGILHKCREQFNKLYNQTIKEIKCDDTLARDKAAAFEIEFSGLVHQCFEIGPEFETLNEEVFNEVRMVFKFTSRYGQFKNWLAREYGITEEKVKLSGRGKPVKILKGIKLKHKGVSNV